MERDPDQEQSPGEDDGTAAAEALLMQFRKSEHIQYIVQLNEKKDGFEYWISEHFRMSAVYWGFCALDMMGRLDAVDHCRDDILQWIDQCHDAETGGYGGNVGHDAHLLYTLSAVQILAMMGRLDRVDVSAVTRFVVGLQRPDGSVAGDRWGEIDTRFCYAAINCLALLKTLPQLDVAAAERYLLRCVNYDGAFGISPGAESHAGQTFTCVAALGILGRLETSGGVDADRLGLWLAERQLSNGGLNGRPEKLPDVCYSWWVLSCLCLLRRDHWIDREALAKFILRSQDPLGGGIADRPGDFVDVYHTFFGIAGFSLMNTFPDLIEPIDPAFALTKRTLRLLNL